MRSAPLLALLALVGSTAVACGGSVHTSRQTAPATPPPTVTTTVPAPATTSTVPDPAASIAQEPLGVAVQSVTFVSATQGWLLGTSAGHERVEETTDGGTHWHPLVYIPPGKVTGIRFADAAHGYAYSRDALDLTSDGGRSWQRLTLPDEDGPADGTGAAEVAIAGGRAWLLNAAAPYPSIYTAPVGSTSFRRVGQSGNRGAFLTVRGGEAYVVGFQGAGPIAPDLEVATTAGVSKRATPCGGPNGQGAADGVTAGAGDTTGLAPTTTAGQLLAVCGGDPTSSIPASPIERSTNDGRTWAGVAVLHTCAATGVAYAASAAYVACSGGGLVRYPLAATGQTTELAGVKLTYVGFTNDSGGVAISDPSGKGGTLYVTRDGGAHWTKAVT